MFSGNVCEHDNGMINDKCVIPYYRFEDIPIISLQIVQKMT